ncbi:MAG: mycothiol synthase [Frankiales bacterium]|jgi:ribosomal protein S18 acetylase RimI-like enzyme|nr:mycothiol synthase [Frankiales bacterium]
MDERAVTSADAPAVAELLKACDIAVLGRWDFTMVELEADLRNDDQHHIGWYDDRDLVAYGWAGEGGQSSKVHLDAYVHPDVTDPAVGVQLLQRLEEIGLGLVAERGHDHALIDIGVYRQDERTQGWLRDRGFTIGTTFTRMRIDVPDPVVVPDPPPGVVVRRTSGQEADLRIAHALLQDAFSEHYGHLPETFEEWRKKWDEHGDNWSELWLADVDGVPAGALIGNAQFVEDDNAGYVRTIGVLSAGRGRGVAKQLLYTYFAASQEAGREAVLLHVDVANVTNALALYESVGMRSILQIDAWAKRSPIL